MASGMPSFKVLLAGALGLWVSGAMQAGSYVYEGRLEDAGSPANGLFDFEIVPHADAALGGPIATAIRFERVNVVDGRFRLGFDLPAQGAEQVWLGLSVRSHGSGDYAAFPGRTKAVESGPIGLCWSSTGDSNTDPAVNFLGTTDAQPLVLRTFNARSLRIEPSSITFGTPALPITTNSIGGSHANTVTTGVRGATIAGGGVPSGSSDPAFSNEGPNRVSDHYGTVGGGYDNQAGNSDSPSLEDSFATVAGGTSNVASGYASFIGGGSQNTSSNFQSTVGGGATNTATGTQSTIGGGAFNYAIGNYSAVVGGTANVASGALSTIGGGSQNNASGTYSTLGGGDSNTASSTFGTVVGGEANSSKGAYSTVGGGQLNCAGGDYSWAGGRRAKVRPGSSSGGACSDLSYPGGAGDQGTFVWADSQLVDFASTGPNQFLIRAQGGVGVNTNTPVAALTVQSADKWNPTIGNGWGDLKLGSATVGLGIGVATSGAGAGAVRVWAKGGNEQIVFTNATQYPTSILSLEAAGRVGVRRAAATNALEVEGNASKSTAGDWLANSDARIKTEVTPIENALDRLMRIRPVSFRYDQAYRAAHPDVEDKRYYNVIAQEYAEVFPEAVQGSGEYLPGAGKSAANEVLQVDFHPASVLTVAAVQELAARVELAERDNRALKAELAELRAALEQLTGADRSGER
jgi:hypothetical protein